MDPKVVAKWAIALLVGIGIITVGFRFSWGGAWVLKPFFVLNCLVLIIVVLLQSGKAADLAGAFGGAGSQTAFGPRGAANVLSKATTWCAIMFMVCAFALVLRTDKAVEQSGSILQKVSSKPAPKPVPAPATTPVAPQPITHDSLPPASQAPASSQPAQQAPSGSQPAPTTSKPAQQPPASSQPAPAPAKKP